MTLVILCIGGIQNVSASLDNGEVNLEAKLSQNDGDVSGNALFLAQDYRVRLSIQVDNPSHNCDGLAAKMSGIEIIGDFEENDGMCSLNLDTREGDNVPALVAGDEIFVAGNDVFLAGILHFT